MAKMTLERHAINTGEQLWLRAVDDPRPDDFSVEDGILPSPPQEETREQQSANTSVISTEQSQHTKMEVGRLIRIPRNASSPRRFDILQQWEGVVDETTDDSVWAEILDLTDRSRPSEIVEIPFNEFAVSDRPLLKPGAVFYWSIGYETSPGGTIWRKSELRVRRTATWSKHAIDSLQAKAKQLSTQYANAEDEPTTAQ